jgi:hypothetical protein
VEAQQQHDEVARRRRDIASQRAVTERRIAELKAEIEAQDAEAARLIAQDARREIVLETDRAAMGASRGVHGNGEDKSQPSGQLGHDTHTGV